MDKYQTIILMMGLAILISINGVLAIGISILCGDEYCDESYTENNPLSMNYCPIDCGITTSSTWCEDTYALIPEIDCPTTTCPTCGDVSCTTSRISNPTLNNWCLSEGYSKTICSAGSGTGADSTINKYNWLIFLIIGGIIGYYYKKNKR